MAGLKRSTWRGRDDMFYIEEIIITLIIQTVVTIQSRPCCLQHTLRMQH